MAGNRQFTVVAAYETNGEQLEFISHSIFASYGNYYSKFPQDAASKAYSSIIEFMKRNGYIEKQDEPELVVMIQEILEGEEATAVGKQYIYFGSRERASQSKTSSRTVSNKDGRSREYLYKNRMIPMKKGARIADAVKSYQVRRKKAMTDGRKGNLK